jgi:acyl-CoA synthetase (AMP-forming)/AMP-acid ligase II
LRLGSPLKEASGMTEKGRKLIAGRWLRWDERRAREAYDSGFWVRATLADALRRAAETTPDRVLIIDGEHRLEARRLRDQATALAQALLARAPIGSVVSFMLPNWHEAAVIYLAATLAGMVAHPILPSLRDRDLAFALQDAESRVIFIPAEFRSHDYAGMLSRVAAQLPAPPEIVVLRGEAGPHTPYETLLTGDPAQILPDLDPDAVRMMLYTSGTTGRPKGVLHSHNSLHALLRQIGRHWLVEPGDRFLVPSPISHIGGSIYAFEAPLLLGTTAILMERWNAEDAIRLAAAEHWTHMAGATPFLQQLLEAARKAGARLPDLKLFICGGASVPPALIREAAGSFAHAVITRVYGSTEVPVTTVGSLDRADIDSAAETDGRPGSAEIRLATHPAAPPGEGEIRARGPQMLVGYLHEEDEADAFDEAGYFRTGDLGRWQRGDHLVVTGRAKDIIIRSGENIAPKEVEDILIHHPAIAEIAIVGLPDPRTGERACAVIVPNPGPAPSVADLAAYLEAQGLAKFKIPEQVVLRDSLPRNDAGKVQKDRLRAAILAEGTKDPKISSPPHWGEEAG